jgi:hypothetical protein
MLHYNPRHASSINMPIFRRTNCIITASGIVTLQTAVEYAGWEQTRKVYAWVSQAASFRRVSPPEPWMRLSSPPIRATCPAYLIRDLITRTILGEEYGSLSFLFCSFLHSPVTSSFLGPNIPQHSILKHPQPTFRPQCEQPNFTPMQNNRENYQYECLWSLWKQYLILE